MIIMRWRSDNMSVEVTVATQGAIVVFARGAGWEVDTTGSLDVVCLHVLEHVRMHVLVCLRVCIRVRIYMWPSLVRD